MPKKIINRGRGPEIEGTRVTIYRIMDFVHEGSSAEKIAVDLDLSAEQVAEALEYICANKAEVESAYAKIMDRISHGNPCWVEAECARTPEELRARILSRRSRANAHADSLR